MSRHQIFRSDFDEGYSKSYQNIKKQFDLGLEQQLIDMSEGNSDYTSDSDNDYLQFSVFNSNKTMNVYYKEQIYEFPQSILELNSMEDVNFILGINLQKLISLKKYNEHLTQEEQESLKKLLPSNTNITNLLNDIFSGKLNYFGMNPMGFFLSQLKQGNLTKLKQKEKEIEYKLYKKRMEKHFTRIYNELCQKIENNKNTKFGFDKVQEMMASNQQKKFKILEELDNLSTNDKKSIQSVQDIGVKFKIEECVSDIDNMSNESFSGKGFQFDYSSTNGQQLFPGMDMINSNQLGFSQNASLLDNLNQELDFTLSENRKIEQQKALAAEAQKLKKNEFSGSGEIFLHISDQVGGQHQIINIPPAKASKATKSAPTIKLYQQGSKDWILNYRKQEAERYQYPTKPWRYYLIDGTTAIVAPVAKKITLTINSKPRDHFLLKPERPPFITILCLVRDAAARLPTFTGTRADICELLKESQYINEHTPDDKLSNIVSGALDRLHYEDDPCVKYDSEKKVWIYLHSDRDEKYSGFLGLNNQTHGQAKRKNII